MINDGGRACVQCGAEELSGIAEVSQKKCRANLMYQSASLDLQSSVFLSMHIIAGYELL